MAQLPDLSVVEYCPSQRYQLTKIMTKRAEKKAFKYAYLDTPIGLLEIAEHRAHLKHIHFVAAPRYSETTSSTLRLAKSQLAQYIKGQRTAFDLPLSPEGTAFQKQVWLALCDVHYGEMYSYQDIAVRIGNIKAVRAVGAANGKNPLSIVIPCHRVVGKNGQLIGYAGGLSRKAWLLALERKPR